MNGSSKGPVPLRKSREAFDSSGVNEGRGSWWRWKTPGGALVMIACPRCHRTIFMGTQHKVADDGLVTPAVRCTTSYCDFERQVQLLGWTPMPTPDEDPEKVGGKRP